MRRRKVKGGILVLIGYILSPLSWWNDLFVNIPISYVAASIISYFYPDIFTAAFVAAYLATNVLGFVLMHIGAEEIVLYENVKPNHRSLLKYIAVAVLYTFLIVGLAELGLVEPMHEVLP